MLVEAVVQIQAEALEAAQNQAEAAVDRIQPRQGAGQIQAHRAVGQTQAAQMGQVAGQTQAEPAGDHIHHPEALEVA
jgi:hypothetical protein